MHRLPGRTKQTDRWIYAVQERICASCFWYLPYNINFGGRDVNSGMIGCVRHINHRVEQERAADNLFQGCVTFSHSDWVCFRLCLFSFSFVPPLPWLPVWTNRNWVSRAKKVPEPLSIMLKQLGLARSPASPLLAAFQAGLGLTLRQDPSHLEFSWNTGRHARMMPDRHVWQVTAASAINSCSAYSSVI
jgi:hypothetical protein